MTFEELEAQNKKFLSLIEAYEKECREVSSGVGSLLLRVLAIEERLEKVERIIRLNMDIRK